MATKPSRDQREQQHLDPGDVEFAGMLGRHDEIGPGNGVRTFCTGAAVVAAPGDAGPPRPAALLVCTSNKYASLAVAGRSRRTRSPRYESLTRQPIGKGRPGAVTHDIDGDLRAGNDRRRRPAQRDPRSVTFVKVETRVTGPGRIVAVEGGGLPGGCSLGVRVVDLGADDRRPGNTEQDQEAPAGISIRLNRKPHHVDNTRAERKLHITIWNCERSST